MDNLHIFFILQGGPLLGVPDIGMDMEAFSQQFPLSLPPLVPADQNEEEAAVINCINFQNFNNFNPLNNFNNFNN